MRPWWGWGIIQQGCVLTGRDPGVWTEWGQSEKEAVSKPGREACLAACWLGRPASKLRDVTPAVQASGLCVPRWRTHLRPEHPHPP